MGTVSPVNLVTLQRSLAKMVSPMNLVTLRKNLVKVMLVNVADVAAEDDDKDDEMNLLQNLLPLQREGMVESADEKKMLQKNHGMTKALFENNGEESADVNGSLTPLSPTESLILMVS